jgi:hypothetical protein
MFIRYLGGSVGYYYVRRKEKPQAADFDAPEDEGTAQNDAGEMVDKDLLDWGYLNNSGGHDDDGNNGAGAGMQIDAVKDGQEDGEGLDAYGEKGYAKL